MADYCTPTDVKSYLNISTTNSDTLLSAMISGYSAAIDNWTNRTFTQTTTTYKANGNGSAILMLKDYPVISVSSVTVDGIAYIQSDGKTSGYIADDFAIYLIGARFNKGFQNVSVSYSFGYATIPNDIKQTVIELVAYKFKETDRIGLQSKTLAGEVISYDLRDVKDHYRSILNNYNRVVPV